MQQGIPGSAPPHSWAPGDNTLGPASGIQSKQSWLASESDDRPLVSQMRAPHLWRVCIYGENVSVDISYGTAGGNKFIRNLRTPIRVTLPGSCDVYARPIPQEIPKPAHAEVTCTPVTSGCCDSECRKIVSGNVNLDADAVRFVALENSSVQLGQTFESITVALTALQEVPLIAGSVLVSGGGFLEFEP